MALPNGTLLSIVIRISDAAIPRLELEAALGLSLDRYEPSTGRSTHYAQIDIAESPDYWSAVLGALHALQGKVEPLLVGRVIGSLSMDVAIALNDSAISVSRVIPASVTKAAGELGMDIEISIYRTSEGALR